jgi:hypothetical protein
VPPKPRRADPGPVFPPARTGFTLKADDTFENLLTELARSTEVRFLVSEPTRSMLRQASFGASDDIDVPAAYAWRIAEILLVRSDVILVPSSRDPWLVSAVAVSSGTRGGAPLKADAVSIDPEDLERYAEHTALIVTVIIDVDPLDARQLSTSLRQQFPDQQTQSILPLTDSQLLLTGFAPSIASLAEMLQSSAEVERKRLAALPPPPAPVPPSPAPAPR